ncbi:hypothetical protein KC363_g43 [Hortaea werneckii]|nr:hypothetical protein KC363_g43 [Hortaea werneckii]
MSDDSVCSFMYYDDVSKYHQGSQSNCRVDPYSEVMSLRARKLALLFAGAGLGSRLPFLMDPPSASHS